jgi:hypothetical protein
MAEVQLFKARNSFGDTGATLRIVCGAIEMARRL